MACVGVNSINQRSLPVYSELIWCWSRSYQDFIRHWTSCEDARSWGRAMWHCAHAYMRSGTFHVTLFKGVTLYVYVWIIFWAFIGMLHMYIGPCATNRNERCLSYTKYSIKIVQTLVCLKFEGETLIPGVQWTMREPYISSLGSQTPFIMLKINHLKLY